MTAPTYLSVNNKSSLIDHIYTNMPQNKIVTKCIGYDVSDHIPSITSIGSIYFNKKQAIKKMIRFSKDFDLENFLADLQTKLNSFTPQGLSANSLWESF